MAYAVLLLVRGFAEGLAQLVAEEIGIVSETIAAARRVQDPAAAVALADRWHGAVGGQVEQDTAVTGQPLRYRCAGQTTQQLGVVGGIDLRVAARRARPSFR